MRRIARKIARHVGRLLAAVGPDGLLTGVAITGLAILCAHFGVRLTLVLDSFAPIIVLGALLGVTALARSPLLLERRPGDRRRFLEMQAHAVRTWSPFVLLYVCYRALRGTMNLIVGTVGVEDKLKALDEALLGVSPSWWMQQFATPWLTELMSYAYALMFVLPLVILGLLYMRDRTRDFREVALAVLGAFYLGFVIYLLVPAKSPRLVYDYAVPLVGNIGIYDLSTQAWDKLQQITYDAFPSLHTAISAIALLYSIRFGSALSRRFPKLLFWIYLPHVILLQISTLYLRQHYFVDLIGGWALALVVYWMAPRLAGAWDVLVSRVNAAGRATLA
jgi:membrane-associated phospholipid phosphatase